MIDILRCTYVVDNATQNLILGKNIESYFRVVRKKNDHHELSTARGGYADRKFIVLIEAQVGQSELAEC